MSVLTSHLLLSSLRWNSWIYSASCVLRASGHNPHDMRCESVSQESRSYQVKAIALGLSLGDKVWLTCRILLESMHRSASPSQIGNKSSGSFWAICIPKPEMPSLPSMMPWSSPPPWHPLPRSGAFTIRLKKFSCCRILSLCRDSYCRSTLCGRCERKLCWCNLSAFALV